MSFAFSEPWLRKTLTVSFVKIYYKEVRSNEVKEKGLETFHKSISSQVYVIKESIARVLEGLKSIVVYDAY